MERKNEKAIFNQIMNKYKLGIIDYYIIRKFLGTFFFALILIISISVVFDISEKLDDFIEKEAPIRAIILDYYFNFIPYFAVLYSYLFTFISVIFFTSRMAYNTEIIAILSNGMSLKRMLLPYFISALIIAIFSFLLSNFVLPHANITRQQFEEMYYRDHPPRFLARNIHKQIAPGVFVYMESFNNYNNVGRKFSMEKFVDGQLVSKLMSDLIRWDSTINKWQIRNYYIRHIDGMEEYIEEGARIDTIINLYPEDFSRRNENFHETLNIIELNRFIEQQKIQGADNIDMFLIERHKRYSLPFSTFILTLIGVAASVRKAKGGIGFHIGLGMLLSFSYILFEQFSSQFAIGGELNPFIAVWIPNSLYALIAIVLYKLAPK